MAFKTQKVWIGTTTNMPDGSVQDERRAVHFEAEEVAAHKIKEVDDEGVLDPTRGSSYTLYRTPDSRLIVFQVEWSEKARETSFFRLHAVTLDDLEPTGAFPGLGAAAGLSRRLTLDEALALA
jgi:hypothetical protein